MRLKRIGFSRYIALEWLNETAIYTAKIGDPEQVRRALNLSINSHEGEEAKRKTIDVLTRIWTRVPEDHIHLRDQALKSLKETRPDEKIWLHWGLLLLAYPIFYDISNTIGRLLVLQGHVTTGQIKRNIIKDWGERTTLNKTISRIIQSLKNWRVLQNTNSNYILTGNKETNNTNLQIWLLESLLKSDPTKVITLQEISRISPLYPFTINLNVTQIINSRRIELINQASNIQLLKLNPKNRHI